MSTCPCPRRDQQCQVLLPSRYEPLQLQPWFGAMPACNTASAVIILNVEPGGIKTLRALVDKRVMIARLQRRPQLAGDAGREQVGIEAGHGDHAQDVARGAVHHDDARRIVTQTPRGIILEVAVDRQLERLAGLVGLRVEVADDASACVDFDAPRARHAAQAGVLVPLDTVLADLETREDQQRITHLLELLGGRRSNVAEQVRKAFAAGINTLEAANRLQPRQVGQIDVDRREGVPVEPVCDLDRHVFRLPRDVAAYAMQLFRG